MLADVVNTVINTFNKFNRIISTVSKFNGKQDNQKTHIKKPPLFSHTSHHCHEIFD